MSNVKKSEIERALRDCQEKEKNLIEYLEETLPEDRKNEYRRIRIACNKAKAVFLQLLTKITANLDEGDTDDTRGTLNDRQDGARAEALPPNNDLPETDFNVDIDAADFTSQLETCRSRNSPSKTELEESAGDFVGVVTELLNFLKSHEHLFEKEEMNVLNDMRKKIQIKKRNVLKHVSVRYHPYVPPKTSEGKKTN